MQTCVENMNFSHDFNRVTVSLNVHVYSDRMGKKMGHYFLHT